MTRSTASTDSGSVKTTKRQYRDANGTLHRLVFREINHGKGPHSYDIDADGVLMPRLDQSLYAKLMDMPDAQLARYFSAH